MPEENTDNTNTDTPDAAENNTGGNVGAGAGTDAANNQGTTEKTFTQKEVDEMFQKRLGKAVKSELQKELKRITGENENTPTVAELQQKLTDAQTISRAYETKDAIHSFINDGKNKIAARTENMRAIEKLVLAEIEYDDEGQPANLKDAVERVKTEAPTLFVIGNGSINGTSGIGRNVNAFDPDQYIRQTAGR